MAPSNLTLAREIAYDTLASVMQNKTRPEDVLEEFYLIHDKSLKRLDKNFIKEIVFGSLRWHLKIYWILQNTATRKLDNSSPEVRATLIAGTYQIYYMDRVPDRSAVNESVEYIRKKGQASACSFVNGILRQIARRSKYFQKPDPKTHPIEYLSLQYAHPEWLVRRWLDLFRFEKLESMLAANNKIPPDSIRVNTRKTDLTQLNLLQQTLLREEGVHSEKSHLRTALRLKDSPTLMEGSLFAQGMYTIQDEADQLIGYLVDPKPNKTIVDACSGTGGKLSHIAELGDRKIKLFAVESCAKQVKKGQAAMKRLDMFEEVCWCTEDFLTWSPPCKIDKILLDAPSSGLGILRRHPEGKWHKPENIIKIMRDQQRKLIDRALTLLPVDGELIYSVCSFEPEECENHLADLKKKYGDKIEVISPVQRLPDYYKRYVTRKNILVIYAGNQDDMDGFASFIIQVKNSLG